MSKAQAVTAENFDKEVLQSPIPVLVDFWAVWCGPCRMIAPHVDAVAEEYAGKVKVVKVDTDQEYDIASKYGIMSIPTLLFFKNGQVADQVIGAVPKSVIARKLEKLLTA
ncbi:MAG: thioredoxin [Chthonomonadales bacterium]